MVFYFVKKGLIILFSLFVVATLTFFILHAIPGSPFTQEQALPEEVLRALNNYYGLDQPLHWQYLHYLHDLLYFDLGPSLKYQGRTVNEIIAEGFPVSFLLGLEAFLIAVTGGALSGILTAFYYLKWQDKLAFLMTILAISIPSFLLGTFLQYLFALQLDLFPIARWGTFSHTLLPAFTLAAFPMAFIARLIRANMIEVLQQDYILTARAKGLSTLQLIWKHAIPNSLLPLLAYLGPLLATVFTGSFVVEKIFGIPGLGLWVVTSIENRDYTTIMGLTLFYSTLLMVSVWMIDLISCFLDPRIQLVDLTDG